METKKKTTNSKRVLSTATWLMKINRCVLPKTKNDLNAEIKSKTYSIDSDGNLKSSSTRYPISVPKEKSISLDSRTISEIEITSLETVGIPQNTAGSPVSGLIKVFSGSTAGTTGTPGISKRTWVSREEPESVEVSQTNRKFLRPDATQGLRIYTY
ncbi:hypothetical protein V1478_004536 [Vespula squamosa]|uniref:Uncharacterized protein n=1 Tax=Vespula squamosa TaxID=30214 RepID=A0ABD2BGG7_VESSQ